MAVEAQVSADPMETLYRELEAKSMGALWRQRYPQGRGADAAAAAYPPMVWRWADVEPLAYRALELVKPGRGEG